MADFRLKAEDAGESAGLLDRAKTGDLEAFDRLMGAHEKQVLGTALRLLGNLEDAQDAAQEAFLRLYKSLNRLPDIQEIKPWLYRVTVNVCNDMHRARRRRGWEPLSGPDPASSQPDPELAWAHQERGRLVELALKTLPERRTCGRCAARYAGAFYTGSSRHSWIVGSDGAVADLCGAREAQEVYGSIFEEAFMNDSEEFEKNAAAMRELTIPAAAFAAVRQRVLNEIEAKKRLKKAWWGWSAMAAAACVAILFVAYVPSNPPRPVALNGKKDPPKIEWTVANRVRPKSLGRSLAQARPVRKTEPLAVVKMLTDDPNVIIIWLVDQKGDSL